MGTILKFELYKLFRQKSFYICTAVMAALTVIGALISKIASKMVDSFDMNGLKYMASAAGNSEFVLIFSIFTALLICDDFAHDTIKNIICKGYGRTNICISKYITSLVAMTIMYVSMIIVSFLIGTAFWGIGSEDKVASRLILQFIVLLGYHAFFFAVSLVIGKTGGAISVNIIVPMMGGLIFTIADSLLKLDNISFSDYWIENAMSVVTDVSSSTSAITVAVIVAIVYAIVFFSAGLFMNKRKQF